MVSAIDTPLALRRGNSLTVDVLTWLGGASYGLPLPLKWRRKKTWNHKTVGSASVPIPEQGLEMVLPDAKKVGTMITNLDTNSVPQHYPCRDNQETVSPGYFFIVFLLPK